MFTHHDIWIAIDHLAEKHFLSPSGLAKKAGLSATLFNPSKRKGIDRNRWPSTESLASILKATNTSLAEFARLINPKPPLADMLPLLALDEALLGGSFDKEGKMNGEKWDKASVPTGHDPSAFMIEITGTSLSPVYQEGQRIIVSPEEKIRRGDRIVALKRNGALAIGQLGREGAHKIEILPFRQDSTPLTLSRSEIHWIYRIVWASQ
jgi:phage repressor protein C with HTH and peptisase S24 domain